MSIELYEIEDGLIEVNGKTVRRDMNRNWVAQEELLPSELSALNGWLKRNR